MTCIKYNNIIDVEYEPAEDATEPVTLDEFKQHLNMLFDTEGSYEFNDDDVYLTGLISAARAAIEKYTGRLLRANTVSAIIRNEKGGQELPYGPVTGDIVLTDCNDIVITTARYSGLSFKSVTSPCNAQMTAVYPAGYTPDTIPADLKLAVLHQGAFLYENRGDQQQEYASSEVNMSASAKALAAPYRRVTWLL